MRLERFTAGLVLAVAAERLVELAVSRRNEERSRARGGVEHGRGHYPAMVALHTALLAGSLLEPVLARRRPRPVLAAAATGAVLAAQGLRWWCVASLGLCWTTRVLVVPGQPPVHHGPYRWLRHPNYLAVVVEGAALPLARSAWLTAAGFTAADLALLAVRVRVEDAALAPAAAAP